MTYPDLAEALQARILVDQIAEKDAHTPCKRPEPNERRALETHIATLEKAVAKAEALGEQRRQEAQTAAKRVEALEVHIATLEEAVTKADALGEQRRQEAQLAAKRVEGLVAALVEMTSELVEMSKRIAEQTATTDKLRAEFDDYRSRSLWWWWWWQHSTG